MINLLTPERQRELLAEYHRRRRLVSGLLGLGSLALALVLLGVLFYHLQAAKREVADALARASAKASGKNALALKEASRVLAVAKHAAREPLLDWWPAVLAAQPSGLIITDWQLHASEASAPIHLALAGKASERQTLLNFIDKLKASETFETVESPISNLIKNRDLDFNIELTLKPAK